MIKAYIVPLKDDKYNKYKNLESNPKQTGHILFLGSSYNRVDIFKSNYYYTDRPNPQSRIGKLEFDLSPEVIRQWCYTFFENCPKHPAIIKLDLENYRQEVILTDEYIEDFVKDNYDEIMEKLNG